MPTRKTSMHFTEEDDRHIERIKDATRVKKDVQAVRYALANCKLPKPTK